VGRREQFEVQTGRLLGKSEHYYGLASQHRKNIQIRTGNFQLEINEEVARITQPNGYCFKYFRNTQRCVQDSMQRIQELRTMLERYNESDAKIATDLEAKANQYREWERQGSRYIAAQNGEEAKEDETPETEVSRSPSVEAPSVNREGEQQAMYQFQFNNPQGQQQQQLPTQQQQMPGMQYNPQMQQQQYSGQFQNQMVGSPWGQQQFQNYNPYMPQQQQQMGYGFQNGGQGYTFNFNGAMGQQQTNNMWGQQQNPYMWGGQQQQGGWGQQQMGWGGQAGWGGGQMGVQPWMAQSPMSYNMGAGMSYWR
jgi:hypothetical protein